MKKIQNIARVLILLSLSASAFAQEPPRGPGMGKPGMKMRMENMSEEQKEQHMRARQEHMLMMHELSNKIIAETDPAKKQALKDQQLEMMKAHKAQMMGHRQKMQHQ